MRSRRFLFMRNGLLNMVKNFFRHLAKINVKIFGDKTVSDLFSFAEKIAEDDWYTEYLGLAVRCESSWSLLTKRLSILINTARVILKRLLRLTKNNATLFLTKVDAAAVYHNASTRFTDGFEFGYGAEIGISTQKLHARGPMGLQALTSSKFVIQGTGQIRE